MRLGFPGKTTEEKMKDCSFNLIKGSFDEKDRPLILEDAFQVIECTWDDTLEDAYEDKKHIGKLEGVEPPYHNFNGVTSKFGCHFILKIDAILMEKEFAKNLRNGLKRNSFPKVPVDYGYRDSKDFWYTKFKKPISTPIASSNKGSAASVRYCLDRIDTDIIFKDEVLEKYAAIPRPFMKAALLQIIEIAKENNIKVIDNDAADLIAKIRKNNK